MPRCKDWSKYSRRRVQNAPEHEERSVSKSPFKTFGVPNGTLKVLNWHLLGFGSTAFT